jgi:hypothetical protein
MARYSWAAITRASAASAMCCTVLVAGSAGAALAGPAVTSGIGTWGTASKVPGTGSLNTGGQAAINSMSCPSTGHCAAGGYYRDAAHHGQAFVVNEINGTWDKAQKVRGLAALNIGGAAAVTSVSCASAGNCLAGGNYEDASGHAQVFVVSEVRGRWGTARQIPGTATLNAGGGAHVFAVSCASPGNCVAGGSYLDGSHHIQAFVVSEVNGTWRASREVRGTAALNAGGEARVTSLSCRSAGNCTGGGSYRDQAGGIQTFVVGEESGTWSAAAEVPGLAALNAGGNSVPLSLSCASAGNCAAGGFYYDAAARSHAYVASETNGTWAAATEVPGLAAMNVGGDAEVGSVSCPSAGNCAAGGFYSNGSALTAFVVSERNGTWGTARNIPGMKDLDHGLYSGVQSVSCSSARNCAAAGSYIAAQGIGFQDLEVFVVNETAGTWGKAVEVPGMSSLNKGHYAIMNSLSCALRGTCAAGGYYTDTHDGYQAFVVSQH